VREFKTAAKTASSEMLTNPVPAKVAIDGTEVEIQAPTSGQLAYLLAMQADSVAPPEQMASVFDFLKALMDPEDYDWLTGLLKSGDMSMELLMEVIEYLVEEWTTVPTTPAPVSSSRPRSSGTRSTAKRPSKA
jgi:hypothetical protein